MSFDAEIISELLMIDDSVGLGHTIDNILKTNIFSREDWDTLVTMLQVGCQESYKTHWLKTHHMVLSAFSIPELLGVDCTLFEELLSIDTPTSIHEASNSFFDVLVKIAKMQFARGGSTLFFDVALISSTQSAIIAADLIQARHHETVLVLNEIDEVLPSLTKEWVDVSRLWRTGNGFRLLKARNLGIHIHVKEYQEIRDRLLREMNINPEKVGEENEALREQGNSDYLQLSETLNEFVGGLIASRGIRGSFDPYYKTLINHQGLDEF